MEAKLTKNHIPVLTSERLILRPFTQDDIQAILNIHQDQDVNRFLPWYPLESLQQAKLFYQEHYENTSDYAWAICLKEDDIPIGYVHVSQEDAYDFGYGLCQSFWHQGIVSEAAKIALEWIKDHSNIPFITATHDINNPYSGAVMQKLGMKYCYSYVELWQPKNCEVTFRMYQKNFDCPQDYVYEQYKKMYPSFVESL